MLIDLHYKTGQSIRKSIGVFFIVKCDARLKKRRVNDDWGRGYQMLRKTKTVLGEDS